jgi:hypothetical protein
MQKGLPIERDVIIWLNSKLEDAWSSEKIASFLTPELLESIKAKFNLLDTSLKLKVFFSFLTLRKKQFSELENEINQILDLGKGDVEDDWVKVISQFLSLILKRQKIDPNSQQKGEHDNESISSLLANFDEEHFQDLRNYIKETGTSASFDNN